MSYKWHHNFPKIAREAGFTIRELSVGHCIDWRFIASIDPYGIVSEQDYEKLDEFIPHISEVPIGNVLNNRILDPAIGKYFVLAQFSIQYLLFCKQFLDETVVEIRNSIQHLQDENVRLDKRNRKQSEEVTSLQKKLHRAENMSQQHIQQASVVFPCSKCTKNFLSADLLNAHMMRKHVNNFRPPEAAFERKPSSTDTNLINTIKLELEVKQLKERLNAAEKDLHDHRSKRHRCRVCSEDSSSTIDGTKAKVLHSVGIQSNLTDDKDSNDKESQTQTDTLSIVKPDPVPHLPTKEHPESKNAISKSDLQSFLDEQKRLFESWKLEERQKFDREIESVKQNLVDVVQAMEKSGRNTPVPVLDNGIWKDRYQELENMYESSQKLARESLASFEKTYTDKMLQLEKLLHEAREIEHKEIFAPSRIENSPQPMPFKSAQLRTVTLPTVVIESEPTDISVKASDRSEEIIQDISTESEPSESDEEIRTLEAARSMPRKEQAVKDPIRHVDLPQNKMKESSQVSQKALLISPKKQILSQFRARLKAIGVDSKSKQLFGESLSVASQALADRRDVLRKKHKHFFVTRNQLLSTVDQMARIKVGETSQHNSQSVQRSEEKHVLMSKEKLPLAAQTQAIGTRLKSSNALELLPSKPRLQLFDKVAAQKPAYKRTSLTGSMSTYKPTIKLTGDDVITVHADVTHSSGPESGHTARLSKRGSVPSYDQQVERLLHTPVKTVNQVIVPDPIHDGAEASVSKEKLSENSEISDALPVIAKPVPKKRVLFNLHKTGHSEATGPSAEAGQTEAKEENHRPHHKTKVDDESDWNISSFDDEK